MDLLGFVDYQFQRYPGSAGYKFWGLATAERRRDHVVRLGLSVGRRLTRWLRTDWEQAYWERECFYQMLAAVGRAKPGQLLREAEELLDTASDERRRADDEAFSVVPLFNDVPGQRGRLVVLSGVARRVERIRVEDPDIRRRCADR